MHFIEIHSSQRSTDADTLRSTYAMLPAVPPILAVAVKRITVTVAMPSVYPLDMQSTEMVKPSSGVGGDAIGDTHNAGVANAVGMPHSKPPRAAQYARDPCISWAELICCVLEKLTMNAPNAASTTSKKMAAMAANPFCPERRYFMVCCSRALRGKRLPTRRHLRRLRTASLDHCECLRRHMQSCNSPRSQ